MNTQILGLVACALLLSACATTGSGIKEDKVAQAKSQVYLDGAVWISASEVKGVCRAGTTTKEWREWVAQASACVSEKNWKVLDQLAQVLARNDMDSPWGAYFHSLAAEGSGDFSRALWMADLAQKKAGGRTALFFYQRGHILISMGETAKGLVEIERALGSDPKFVEGQLYLAQIYHRDQQLDLAAKNYEGVLTNDAKNYLGLTGLAEVRLRQGSGVQAAELYQRAVSSQPGQIQPWLRLAYIYETIQKSPELALSTYKSLQNGLNTGSIRGPRPELDLPSKIKTLEQVTQPRQPAQASAKEMPVSLKDAKRSTK